MLRRGAIVGFGNVALHGHLPGWQAQSDFRIVAVADPDSQRRALALKALPEARIYSDLTSLLAREDIDFVDVASPPAYHASAVTEAATAGKHILCEKPLTTALDEYAQIRSAAHRHGVVVHTVHNWKHSEAFRLVQAKVAAGGLGTLRSIVFDTARNGCSATTGENWRVDATVAGGGILVDHGWHAFYLLLNLAGQRPQAIRATLANRRFFDSGVEDTVSCHIDFPDLTGEIHLTWAADSRHTRWQLRGDGAELTIDDDRVVWVSNGEQQEQRLTTPLSAGSHHADWFGGVIDEFRAAMEKPAEAHGNRAEVELCLTLLSLAYTSAAQGGKSLPIPATTSLALGSESPITTGGHR